jgi:protein TonB
MSARLAVALSVSGALHLAVAAALISLPARQLEEPPEQGVGIEVVFSTGGGGAQRGEAVPEAVPAAAATPAEPAPPDVADLHPPEPRSEPPPAQTAALPLPPPAPSRPAPAPSAAASMAAAAPSADPLAAAAAPTAGLLDAALPAAVGRKVDPVVPREARLNRWQGTVLLAVTVSPEGVPSGVEIVRSSGYALLDRAAIEAMWQWRFDPARRAGVPVEERIAIPITFRIVD